MPAGTNRKREIRTTPVQGNCKTAPRANRRKAAAIGSTRADSTFGPDSVGPGFSEAEAQSDRGSDVVALEKAEGQSAIHLREHDPGIEIPLWCKPPIDSSRDRIERAGALRVFPAGAGSGPGGGVEERILDIMVIGANHIQIFGNSVL